MTNTVMLRICYSLLFGATLMASGAWAGQRVASDYRDYRIPLNIWRPTGVTAMGVVVPVRIDGGRPLRLVLDSGASGITISNQTARELQLGARVEAKVTGFGRGRETVAHLGVAESVVIGDLRFEDCPIRVVGDSLTRGADGVIGTDFFGAFRIRLDAAAKELRLEAFREPQASAESRASHLLFVKATVNGQGEGLFLVDTGSAVTSLASDVRWPRAMAGNTMNLTGVSGEVPEAKYLAPVSLEIEGKKVVERQPVALNLEAISRRNGIKVAGILGYSVLSRTGVTFDYREGSVALSSR